jgi:flagellar motor switch protein FliN
MPFMDGHYPEFMSTLAAIDIRALVTASVTETFNSLLSIDIEPVEQAPAPEQGKPRMVGALNFAGKVTGIFTAQVTFDFGRIMLSSLLGSEPEDVEPGTELRDLVAEITNIVGGNLKSALNDAGLACVLSTPSVTYGSDFSIESLVMERFERFVFHKDDHLVIIEVGLKEQQAEDTVLDFSFPEAVSRIPRVDLQRLDLLDYKSKISEAVAGVFETMFSLRLEPAETSSGSGLTGMRNVSSVSFVGDATGHVSLHVGQELSRMMAANMLGMEPDEITGTEEIVDMLGEASNIVGGSLKSALTDTGLRCVLSTPSFTNGTDFMIESLNLERYERFAFECESHIVYVEMGVKISELVKASGSAGKDIHIQAEESTEPINRQPAESDAPVTADVSPGASERGQEPRPSAIPPLPSRPEAAHAEETRAAPGDFDLELLLDIPVELTVELGRTQMPISDLLKLHPGAAVKLARLEGEPVDILANDVLIARGEVVVRNEKYGIRITEITSRVDRLRGLK